ncbi:flagellar biosynthetic protein FliO [Piscirickettsia salmonis]|uniref:flagellar biosynthetic protein FliO n=1 Tax=Piscirickettsia salmonis TaxID=1238 RepID=UPI0007C8BD18|nr:Flagellar protein FliO [Piscirickettsiaceae bacterium NZ-RLO1]
MKNSIYSLLFFICFLSVSLCSYADTVTMVEDPPIVGASAGFISSTAWQMLWSSLLVILLIIGLGIILKRLQQRGFNRQEGIEIIATLAIGSKERLVIVQVGKEQVLLGVTAQHIQTLHVLNECIQAKERESQNFQALLLEKIAKIKPTKLNNVDNIKGQGL